MLDPTHEVQLSANDGLGLLKDIALDKYPMRATAFENNQTAQGYFNTPPFPQNLIYLRNSFPTPPVVGVPFIIAGHSNAAMNGAFTPNVVTTLSGVGNYNIVTSTFTGNTVADNVTINGFGGTYSFETRNSLLSVIAICLQNTGLELDTYIYENIFEVNQITTESFLNQTFVSLQTFISGEDYESCYNVLEKICQRFNLTIFQSFGRWNIIRWDGLRLDAAIPGFSYDSNFELTGTITLDAGFTAGFQEDVFPVTGLIKSGVRPWEYVKETFNYQQPKYLLANNDLQNLGAMIRTVTSGDFTYTDYAAVDFFDGDTPPHGEIVITVVFQISTQTETDRYLVVKFPQGVNARAVRSPGIEVKQGDKATISMKMRLNFSQSLPLTTLFSFRLSNGSDIRYLKWTGVSGTSLSWDPTFGYDFPTLPNTPATAWQELEAIMPPFPFDGILTIHYPLASNAIPNRPIGTWFKDIRLDYTAYINESTKIIGHIHNDLQPVLIKNNNESEIYMDDSPRNSLSGTLFLNSFTSLLQNKTTLWGRVGVTESVKLGEIITKENLQWRSQIRTRLDGDFMGINEGPVHLSMLNHFTYTQLPGLNFLFGNLQIDYRNDRFNCSATEIFKNGETDVTQTYSFNYIYDLK